MEPQQVPRRSYASLAGGKRGAVAAFEREHSYAASPTPVVITGSPHTPGWTLDELIERAGKLQLPISMGNEESALDGLRTTKRLMSLRDYAPLRPQRRERRERPPQREQWRGRVSRRTRSSWRTCSRRCRRGGARHPCCESVRHPCCARPNK